MQVNKRNLSNVMLSAGRAQALMEHEEQHHEEVPLQLDSSGPSDGIFRDTITSLGALGSHHGGHSKCSMRPRGQTGSSTALWQHCDMPGSSNSRLQSTYNQTLQLIAHD